MHYLLQMWTMRRSLFPQDWCADCVLISSSFYCVRTHSFSNAVCSLMHAYLVTVFVMATAYSPSSFYAPALPSYLEKTVSLWTRYTLSNVDIFVLQFGQNTFQIGLLYFATAACYLLVALPLGPITDKVVSCNHAWLFNRALYSRLVNKRHLIRL